MFGQKNLLDQQKHLLDLIAIAEELLGLCPAIFEDVGRVKSLIAISKLTLKGTGHTFIDGDIVELSRQLPPLYRMYLPE
jgi:hypothetical protein